MSDVFEQPGCQHGLVTLGRLSGQDREAILAVFEGMSERSRRLRFHGPKPRLSESELDRLVDVGCCGREAVVAVDQVSGQVVGIARFVRSKADPRSAEVAFEVVDECHGSGVGRKLLAELKQLALREGVERFSAVVVGGNEPAFALLRHAGPIVRSSYEGSGAYDVVVELAPLSHVA